jgi:para-aminobenzoate synthetase component 2
MNIILIDNNDSFTHNLEHLLATVVSSASIVVEPYSHLANIDFSNIDLAVISPGPGAPADYPGYDRLFAFGVPTLGICLGMQIINEHWGGRTARFPGCMHGKTSCILFDGTECIVARYHSLCVTQVADGLDVISETEEFVPMCLGNREDRVLGYQFHPESFLTSDGGAFIDYALDYLNLR